VVDGGAGGFFEPGGAAVPGVGLEGVGDGWGVGDAVDGVAANGLAGAGAGETAEGEVGSVHRDREGLGDEGIELEGVFEEVGNAVGVDVGGVGGGGIVGPEGEAGEDGVFPVDHGVAGVVGIVAGEGGDLVGYEGALVEAHFVDHAAPIVAAAKAVRAEVEIVGVVVDREGRCPGGEGWWDDLAIDVEGDGVARADTGDVRPGAGGDVGGGVVELREEVGSVVEFNLEPELIGAGVDAESETAPVFTGDHLPSVGIVGAVVFDPRG